MSWFYVISHIIPLYREYRFYRKTVELQARMIYARRRNNRNVDWAREYLTSHYLERHYLTFFEWIRAVR